MKNVFRTIKMRLLPASSKSFYAISTAQTERLKNIQRSIDELYGIIDGKEQCYENYSDLDDKNTIETIRRKYELLKSDHYEKLRKAGSIRQDALKNCKVYTDRYASLECIPKGAVVAEVGVAYGDYSKNILEHTKPTKFYAIDYFSQDDPYGAFWGREDFKRDNMTHQQWYENKFRNEMDQGLVIVKQGFSWEVLNKFDDNYFDFIYLDAAHDYASVLKDIKQCYKKIKNGGLIQFNDYINYDANISEFYGVVPIVNDFVNSGEHEVVGFCLQLTGFHDVIVKVKK